MAKTLKGITLTLLPDGGGLTYATCNATYTVGTTDDSNISSSRQMIMSLPQDDLNAIKKLWGDCTALVKTNEGIK